MKRFALLLILAGCGEREAGITVDVTARVLTPSQGTWIIERLQLLECESAWRRWAPISTAYAHGGAHDEDPRLFEGIITLALEQSAEQHLATFHPPPGEVCGLSVLVSSPQRRFLSFPIERTPLDADHLFLSLQLTLDDETLRLR